MRGIGGFLFENLGLKLVSVLLAFVVYLHVYTERPATMVVSFPVEVTGLPDSLAVTRSEPAAIAAELTGTGKQLIRLRLTEPAVRLSMAGAQAGVHHRRVTVEDLPVRDPEPLEVARIVEPAEVLLEIERVIARSVPVVARFTGAAADGTVPEWSAQPANVLLRGPRSVIAGIDSLVLEPVKAGSRDTLKTVARIADVPRGCVVDPASVVLRIAPARGGP